MNIPEFKVDVSDEVASILASDFTINVTETQTVPHSNDAAITFPNFDERTQGTKLINTAVLYVDMRRSTQLSLQHRSQTVAKLYSAFVRAMTRCAQQFGGEVRGIIGDRVMILFEARECFTEAVDTAILINSVCKYVLNKHFIRNDVSFGIGIDYGRMLATKTGIRRHGAAQQSYRSLVWLGRPANIASKLTDNANKKGEKRDLEIVNVTYVRNGAVLHVEEWPHLFLKSFYYNSAIGMMCHFDPAFRSFSIGAESRVIRPATPEILMSKRVYDGFRAARPQALSIVNNWFAPVQVDVPGLTERVYGGDVIFRAFKG